MDGLAPTDKSCLARAGPTTTAAAAAALVVVVVVEAVVVVGAPLGREPTWDNVHQVWLPVSLVCNEWVLRDLLGARRKPKDRDRGPCPFIEPQHPDVPISNQVRLPAELKHISKRRKRN
jgi:hypothetical protein